MKLTHGHKGILDLGANNDHIIILKIYAKIAKSRSTSHDLQFLTSFSTKKEDKQIKTK